MNMKSRTIYLTAILIGTLLPDIHAIQLQDLLKNAKAYDKKHVQVVGIARVQGDFYLFPDLSAASRLDRSKGAWIVQQNHSRDYFVLDRQWILVAGSVNANAHGRGVSPCEILPERVEILRNRAQPRIKDSNVYATFENTTASELHVELRTSSNATYSEVWIGPHGKNGVAIRNGKILAFSVEGDANVPVWRRGQGKLIAQAEIKLPKLDPSYEYSPAGSRERTVRYQIAKGNIALVSPTK